MVEKPKDSQLSEQDVIELLAEWSFLGNVKVQPTNQGTVNTTFFVEAQAGKFVLKLYNDYIFFTQSEIDALILVWRLQRASCIVYWTGWFLEGKTTQQSIVDTVVNTVLLEKWLEKNTDLLLSYSKYIS